MKEFIIGDGEWCKYPHELMKGKPQTQQMVMLYLLSHRHNKTGACFPSISTLAKEIGLKTKKPVQNALKALENDGLVVRTPCFKQDGGRSSDRYTLAIKKYFLTTDLLECLPSIFWVFIGLNKYP